MDSQGHPSKRLPTVASQKVAARHTHRLLQQKSLLLKPLITKRFNPLKTNVPHHIETSQLICRAKKHIYRDNNLFAEVKTRTIPHLIT